MRGASAHCCCCQVCGVPPAAGTSMLSRVKSAGFATEVKESADSVKSSAWCTRVPLGLPPAARREAASGCGAAGSPTGGAGWRTWKGTAPCGGPEPGECLQGSSGFLTFKHRRSKQLQGLTPAGLSRGAVKCRAHPLLAAAAPAHPPGRHDPHPLTPVQLAVGRIAPKGLGVRGQVRPPGADRSARVHGVETQGR